MPRRSERVPAPRRLAAATRRPLSATYVWRRLHDGDLIAEASLIPGVGTWRVSAYRVSTRPDEACRAAQSVSLLTDAHRTADALVAKHYDHVCRTGVCGRWIRWRIED